MKMEIDIRKYSTALATLECATKNLAELEKKMPEVRGSVFYQTVKAQVVWLNNILSDINFMTNS